MDPQNPIAAVTHHDPYPYYADLVASRPFYRDDALGMWVASSAAAVDAILTDRRLRVRPPGAQVPSALVGTAAGTIFGHLVRMNDGSPHQALKPAIAAAIDGVDRHRVVSEAVRLLARSVGADIGKCNLNTVLFTLPVAVVARLLGATDQELPIIVEAVNDFVKCIPAHATSEAIAAANQAATQLLGIFRQPAADRTDGLFSDLVRGTRKDSDIDSTAVAANAIGLMSQTCEATAGLIGNTLVAFARNLDLLTLAKHKHDAIEAIVSEVARHDSPIQNTRRFAAEACRVAGVTIAQGDAILVVLAAANRDPQANPAPHQFTPDRNTSRIFTFGAGLHKCPGAALANSIATIVIRELIAGGLDARGHASVRYWPSANARIPDLGPVAG
jgi:cytochrome P450